MLYPLARPRRRRALGAAPLLLLIASCSPGAGASAVEAPDEQTFVSAFVELRRAAAQERTNEAFARRREEILSTHGVTAETLERFIDVHADDLDYLSDVWDRIDRTLRGELDAEGNVIRPGSTPDAEGNDSDN
ncbi:MAG: hypothetical protein ABFS34_10845 [Gemmatimonadota bacterium]